MLTVLRLLLTGKPALIGSLCGSQSAAEVFLALSVVTVEEEISRSAAELAAGAGNAQWGFSQLLEG